MRYHSNLDKNSYNSNQIKDSNNTGNIANLNQSDNSGPPVRLSYNNSNVGSESNPKKKHAKMKAGRSYSAFSRNNMLGLAKSEHSRSKKFNFPMNSVETELNNNYLKFRNRGNRISTKSPASITSRQSMVDNNKRIELILKSSKQSVLLINNLVNDLLDYAKLESATFKLRNQYFDFKQEIDKAISMMYWNAKEKNIKVAMLINPVLTKYLNHVYGDNMRICRIIINLLSNSIKFTPPKGSIHIEVNVKKLKVVEEEVKLDE